MVSDDGQQRLSTAKERYDEAVKRIAAECATRRQRIVQINSYARGKGLDTTTAIVARHLQWFERWYAGGIATGYLIKRTGVTRINTTDSRNGG